MSQTELLDKKRKRQAVVASLRVGKFAEFKSSSLLIDTLKQQKDAAFVHKCSQLVVKQQQLVRRLNEENMRLVDVNDALKMDIGEAQRKLHSLDKKNKDLVEQNNNLREQLATSQNFGSRVLNELKIAQHRMRQSLSNKN